jgi:hypothetical protein
MLRDFGDVRVEANTQITAFPDDLLKEFLTIQSNLRLNAAYAAFRNGTAVFSILIL